MAGERKMFNLKDDPHETTNIAAGVCAPSRGQSLSGAPACGGLLDLSHDKVGLPVQRTMGRQQPLFDMGPK
jgi:hypothetical protein